MKTLIFIHGGESFATEKEYQIFLRETYINWQSEPWTPEEKKSWTQEIAKKWYARGDQVYMPTFPNKLDAKYEEWKIIFEGILAKLTPDHEITLIGGSLGGCFLLKYFSENTLLFQSKNILQVHLMAACLSEGDFTPPDNFDVLKDLGNKVHIWHAEDDKVVPFATAKFLEKALPEAETHFFDIAFGYGHFHGIEGIPELERVVCGN